MKRNVAANYAGQLYVAGANILVVPELVRLLGAEAYGLVGFFAMLQAWLLLLDMGVSPTLGREASRYKSGKYNDIQFDFLVKFLNRIFFATALIFVVVLLPASPWLASHWLQPKSLRPEDVSFSVAVMLLTVAIRWRTQPHRSVIIGMEHQVWMNGFGVFMASLRTIGAVGLLEICGDNIRIFFLYQLALAVLEAAGMYWKVKSLVPSRPLQLLNKAERKAILQPLWKMSLALMATTSAWTILTQLDRLVLSKTLPLSEFGVFTMATLCASGVTILGSPVTSALAPRLTSTIARSDEALAVTLYRSTTRFSACVVLTAAFVIAFFAKPLLWTWSNNAGIADKAAPILFWYALGNGFQSMTALFYNLQYAFGSLKLHLLGYAIFTLAVIPAFIFAALHFGAIGTGVVWFIQSITYLIGWGWVVHRKFVPGLYARWILVDILSISVPVLLCIQLLNLIPVSWNHSRMENAAYLLAYSVISICVAFSFNRDFQSIFKNRLNNILAKT